MILLTGASGFVGTALLQRLVREGHKVRACVRQSSASLPAGVDRVQIADIAAQVDWSAALQGVQVLVHTAARAHIMRDSAADPLAAFRQVNVNATVHLARQAAAAGVRRFVYLSSVKVHGEATLTGQAFRETDVPAPQDAYAQSKLEAEQALRQVARDSGLELVIVRPTLVYGPGVKANFAALVRVVQRGLPLPLGAVRNQRSLLGLDNLVDFLLLCMTHRQAAGQTFLVSDGHDISTPELLRKLACALGVRAQVFAVPLWLLQAGAMCLGKGAWMRRLCGNLQVDISKARQVLGWAPPVSLEEGLAGVVLPQEPSDEG